MRVLLMMVALISLTAMAELPAARKPASLDEIERLLEKKSEVEKALHVDIEPFLDSSQMAPEDYEAWLDTLSQTKLNFSEYGKRRLTWSTGWRSEMSGTIAIAIKADAPTMREFVERTEGLRMKTEKLAKSESNPIRPTQDYTQTPSEAEPFPSLYVTVEEFYLALKTISDVTQKEPKWNGIEFLVAPETFMTQRPGVTRVAVTATGAVRLVLPVSPSALRSHLEKVGEMVFAQRARTKRFRDSGIEIGPPYNIEQVLTPELIAGYDLLNDPEVLSRMVKLATKRVNLETDKNFPIQLLSSNAGRLSIPIEMKKEEIIKQLDSEIETAKKIKGLAEVEAAEKAEKAQKAPQ